MAAPNTQPTLVPKYQVEPLIGSVLHEKLEYQSEEGKPDRYGRPRFIGKGFVATKVKEPAGYMVYFPSGHCIRVRNHDELVRLGFAGPAPMVDPTTGEEINPNRVDLARQASAKVKPDLILDDEENA